MRVWRVCRKGHELLLATLYEFAVASRVTAKLISDIVFGFAAAHNPPHMHFEPQTYIALNYYIDLF